MRVKYNNQVIECTGIEYKSDTEIEIWTEWGTYTAKAIDGMKFSKKVLDKAVIYGYCDLDEAQYRWNMVQIGGKPEDAIKKFSIAIMIVLLIIAMVIISNTVKLTVYNRRKEINIMKYIGATDRFIRAPFVLEGLIIGFVGAVLAFVLVFWAYFAILRLNDG